MDAQRVPCPWFRGDLDEVQVQVVEDIWGGGRYRLEATNENGVRVLQKTVEIHGVPEQEFPGEDRSPGAYLREQDGYYDEEGYEEGYDGRPPGGGRGGPRGRGGRDYARGYERDRYHGEEERDRPNAFLDAAKGIAAILAPAAPALIQMLTDRRREADERREDERRREEARQDERRREDDRRDERRREEAQNHMNLWATIMQAGANKDGAVLQMAAKMAQPSTDPAIVAQLAAANAQIAALAEQAKKTGSPLDDLLKAKKTLDELADGYGGGDAGGADSVIAKIVTSLPPDVLGKIIGIFTGSPPGLPGAAPAGALPSGGG